MSLPSDERLPVAVLFGIPGVKKAGMLEQLLRGRRDLRVALIVNETVEAGDVAVSAMASRAHVTLIQGCICCERRKDFLAEVRRLVAENRFDRLIVESGGICDPLSMAAIFAARDIEGYCLSDIARLDTFVTFVNASSLIDDYFSGDSLAARVPALGVKDQRPFATLLADQLEFASVIVLNEIDMLDITERQRAQALVRALNPSARIVGTLGGELSSCDILGTGDFDFGTARRATGCAHTLRGEALPQLPGVHIHGFVYRARRPFHPQRLVKLLNGGFPGVVRAKGHFWLATRMEWVGELSIVGRVASYEPLGFWWATVPDEARAMAMPHIKDWDPQYGDRCQELVFVGMDMDEARLRWRLNGCLLTDAEMARGPAAWVRLPDPLPRWEMALPSEDALTRLLGL